MSATSSSDAMTLAVAVIILAVIWLVAVGFVLWLAFSRQRPVDTITPPPDRPLRPSLESIEHEMEINARLDRIARDPRRSRFK